MGMRTIKIGLSLGADICWPICYENLLSKLDHGIVFEGETCHYRSERISIEPFDLRQPVSYDLVIDRLTHWYIPTREWIKKGILVDDLYVYNNPWSLQANEKHTSYAAMIRLGLPIPDTWLLPPKSYAELDDLEPTLTRYARMFSLDEIGEKIGYPFFMKPYHGGGWKGVSRIDNIDKLHRAYDDSGVEVMNLQAAIDPYDRFVRTVGLGPQLRPVDYDPSAPLHDRYRTEIDFLESDERRLLEDMTLTINSFFGWDFNSCEALRRDGQWHPIDFANACPDSQVTSLHYHFPWLIKANLRWSIYCATTGKRMQRSLDWEPYFEIADKDIDFREKLERYAALANRQFETDRFREFCRKHLSQLDEISWEFFGSELARDAVRQKVLALFPAEEVEEFTELFWQRIQQWRDREGERGDSDFH